MVLFGVPDIRLFWSRDPRFLNQFSPGTVSRFKSFSKFPECYKDVAFWVNDTGVSAAGGGQLSAFHENDLMELLREEGAGLIEDVRLVPTFAVQSDGRWMNLDTPKRVEKVCVIESTIDPWKGLSPYIFDGAN